jgi:hypothetical protein
MARIGSRRNATSPNLIRPSYQQRLPTHLLPLYIGSQWRRVLSTAVAIAAALRIHYLAPELSYGK